MHGFTGAALDFVDVIAELATSRRVVAYDQRGHGDSTNTGDASTYTFDQLTTDLATFVDNRELAPMHLLGHSMGGMVALKYVLTYPEHVHSLILMDTAAAPALRVTDVFGGLLQIGREQGMDGVFDVVRQFWVQQAEAAGVAPNEVILARSSRSSRAWIPRRSLPSPTSSAITRRWSNACTR